jgi:hypothetical protein
MKAETDFESMAAKLVADIEKLRKAVARIDSRRAVVSLDARIGDTDARKEYDKLASERNAKLAEIDDLTAALTEAKRRAGEALKTSALEAEAERARKAQPILERMAARGKALDDAIARYCAEFAAISEDVDALMALGCPVATRDLIRVNLRNAHDSATMFLDKTSRPVSPRARKSFSELLLQWTRPGVAWVAVRTNNTAQAA